ncbi:UNVERIFIED_CONTAM: BTB/POZ domain-containing protein [Sesamum calycinum]|uniref:BTB/POZ domain-containing protein n=1 Tax=Sesamum calycinum TaxID=2727403 RepID=A0AAW2SCY8_9LAMI
MAPAGKISEFHRDGNDWFCNANLPSDITLVVDGMYFHLHKFPLISRCGRIANIVEESRSTIDKTFKVLEEFPGGADTFFMIVKFCYSGQVEFTPKNVWKDCILALQSCEPVIPIADKLQIISRCLNALSVMVCTDRSLFGWPMMMYGRMQSPGGSILWNGINTGARIDTSESDWWFEDISCLCIELFERLIQTMAAKGIRPRNLAHAIMYYCKKYLPGLDRRQGGQSGISTKVVSFSIAPAAIDEGVLLQRVVKFLPEKKGKSFCRFLLGLLRVALILGINHTYQDLLEKKIEVASDVNMKPGKVRSLAEALPESSRFLHDGLYRALDIYFKAHPWLLEKEREQMCTIIDFQKLSIDACAHASQNERLPLRVILQVLFFEQLQLRTSLAGCLHALDAESALAASATAPNEITDQIAQRGGG